MRLLALNFCNIQSWSEVQLLEHLLPCLEELYLAGNNLPDLPRLEAEMAYRDATGIVVKLESNGEIIYHFPSPLIYMQYLPYNLL